MKSWFGWLVVAIVTWALVGILKAFWPVVWLALFGLALLLLVSYQDPMPIAATAGVCALFFAGRKVRNSGPEK